MNKKLTRTLIVKYTPRNEKSNTKKILDAFIDKINDSHVEELDLTKDVPDMLLEQNLLAYICRNLLGQNLSPEQSNLLSKMDRMTGQLKSADFVVVAYPMIHFTMPAVVKAWFESVMVKGQTIEFKDGRWVGLMQGKKALVLVTSGGSYEKEPMTSWEHAFSLGKTEFQFMGYSDVQGVFAEGMEAREKIKTSLERSINEVQNIAQEWYHMANLG